MATFALATPVLNDGDAVGYDILGMARTLRALGHAVSLFAEKARVTEDVLPLDSLSPTSADRLIYHHSVQCDPAVRAAEAFGTRAIIKYHNVTPSRFFADVNPDAVQGADIGRQQAIRLAKSSARFWVDSAFNARDLADDVPNLRYDVLPPFHQAEVLLGTRPDTDNLGDADAWTTAILCVGRIAPNKHLELAVETLAAVRAAGDPLARLILAGEHVFPAYSERLMLHADKLGVAEAIIVTGRVSTAQLVAWYRVCDLLFVSSAHEGFCVPLVEAMALGVPVVAVPRTAIPDTGGDAITYADATGEQLASAIGNLLRDGAQREARIAAGRQRYAECFSMTSIERQFAELVRQSLAT